MVSVNLDLVWYALGFTGVGIALGLILGAAIRRRHTGSERVGTTPTSIIENWASVRGCQVRAYIPGTTHEHTCVSSSPHSRLDHTCECGYTWPNEPVTLIRFKDDVSPEEYAEVVERFRRSREEQP